MPAPTLYELFPNARITSGYRTRQRQQELINQGLTKATNSDHLTGDAVDFQVPGMTTDQVKAKMLAAGMPNRVIISEGNHTHWSLPKNGASTMPAGFSADDVFANQPPAAPAQPAASPASAGGFSADDVFADQQPGGPTEISVDRGMVLTDAGKQFAAQHGQEPAFDPNDPGNGTFWQLSGGPAADPVAKAPRLTRVGMLEQFGPQGGPDLRQKSITDLITGGDGQPSDAYRLARAKAEDLFTTPGGIDPDGGFDGFSRSLTAPLQPSFDGWFANAAQRVVNLKRRLSGEPIEYTGDDAGRAWADTERYHNRLYAEKHPGMSILGGFLGGSAAGPAEAGVGLLPNLGKTVAGRLTMATGFGAGEEAAAAEPGHRLEGALKGGATGAVVGGAFEAGAPLVSRAVSAARSRFLGAPRFTSPERKVATAIQRAVDRDGVPLRNPVPGQMPFETGGENLAGLAESAGQAPGAARQQAVGTLTARRQTLGQRVIDGVHGITGQNLATALDEIGAQAAAGREAASPLYDAAYDEGPLSSPALDQLMRRPSMKKALAKAKAIAAEEGRDPHQLGFSHFEDPAQWETASPAGPSMGDTKPPAPKGRAPAAAPPSQGKSLLKFIADGGGIKDTGGEVRAMDGDLWHRRKAFQSKLIGTADTADGWAQRAFEAGYFPERTSAPAQNEMLDAMATELRGRPRFAREPSRADTSRQPTEAEERDYRGADGVDPAEYETGRPMPQSEPLFEPTPTTQTYDYVKRGLDDVLETYRDPVTRKLNLDEEGRAVQNTLHALRGELTSLNPKYRTALRAGGDPIRLEQAFRDAPKLLSQNVTEAQFSQRVENMGDAEKQAMVGGWAASVRDLARAGRLRPGMYRNQALQSKLTALIGRDKAAAMIGHMEDVAGMAERTNQVLGNSATARRAMGAQDLNADPSQGIMDTVTDTAVDLGDLNFGTATRRLVRAGLKAIPRKDRSILGGANSNPLLGDALFGEGGQMERLLKLLEAERARRIGGSGARAPGVAGAAGGLLSAQTGGG